MAIETYTYSISADIPAGKVDITRLWQDIQTSSIVTALENIKVAGDTLSVIFKATLSAGDRTTLDNDTSAPAGGLIGAHTGLPLTETTQVVTVPKKAGLNGEQIVSPIVPQGGGQRYVTHNLCDACTWWQESQHSPGMTTSSGDQLVYTLDDTSKKLIDIRHGRLVFEDDVTISTVAPNGNTMTDIVPTVKIDGVPLDQANEDAASGNDRYVIDYAAGTITFAVARGGGEAITLDCRRVGAGPEASKWTLRPNLGYRLATEDAEADMSDDIDMDPTQPIVVKVYASHPVITGGFVVPVEVRKYKTFHDFHAASRHFYGPIPSGFGGGGGVLAQKWTFQWKYLRADTLYYTANFVENNYYPGEVSKRSMTGNKVEIFSTNDREVPGSVLTIIFFAGEELESA